MAELSPAAGQDTLNLPFTLVPEGLVIVKSICPCVTIAFPLFKIMFPLVIVIYKVPAYMMTYKL